MIWLLVALLSSVVAGVGFWRGSVAGLSGRRCRPSAGVLFCLLMFRATTLVKDGRCWGSRRVADAGGRSALFDRRPRRRRRRGDLAREQEGDVRQLALPTAVLAYVLLITTALRLSVDSPRRTHFYALALASAVNAASPAYFFVSTQVPRITG